MSKSAPEAPDYQAAAQEQAQSSREVTEQQTWANRPTINTPFGQQTWEVAPQWDPATGQYINTWTQNTNLTPESQGALDSQMRLQQGRSGLAESLLGRAQSEYGDTMDWSQFDQLAETPEAGQYGQNLPGMEALPNVPNYDTGNLPGRGQYNQGALPGRGGQLQGSDYDAMLAGLPGRSQGPNQGQYSSESIQRQLDTAGLQDVDPSQRYNQDAESAIFGQWENRAAPEFERQEEGLRTSLYNKGLREGDEAFDREIERMRTSQGDARTNAQYQATIGAGQEAQRMHGMDLGTRGQQFGERSSTGAFANNAAQQALQQQLGIGGQRFSEQLAGGQFGEQQRQAAFGEQMGAAQAGFGEQQAVAGQADAQRQAALTEQMGYGQAQDAQRAAAMQEMLGTGAQQFQQGMARAGQGDARRQQMGQEQLAFGGQRFNEQMQAAGYQNTLRQQQISEEMQRRGFSLNEINAILTGQQVGMPSMPGFNTAQRSEGVQSLSAAQMQGQAALDSFNAEQQATQGMMSGIAGGAMMFSDRRLKKYIVKVGNCDDNGLQRYQFNYIWEQPNAPSHIGYMADEVEKLYPDCIATFHGYKAVDYARVPGWQ